MTSRQGPGRWQEPTSKIATPKVPIHPFVNVRLRVRDVCCGSILLKKSARWVGSVMFNPVLGPL
jgi:hypothetical protein